VVAVVAPADEVVVAVVVQILLYRCRCWWCPKHGSIQSRTLHLLHQLPKSIPGGAIAAVAAAVDCHSYSYPACHASTTHAIVAAHGLLHLHHTPERRRIAQHTRYHLLRGRRILLKHGRILLRHVCGRLSRFETQRVFAVELRGKKIEMVKRLFPPVSPPQFSGVRVRPVAKNPQLCQICRTVKIRNAPKLG
jgi:hypothetical protein